MKYFDRITVDPKVMAGKPSIRDTRITVSLILNLLSQGQTNEEIMSDYPEIEREDILAALKYGEWASSDTISMVSN